DSFESADDLDAIAEPELIELGGFVDSSDEVSTIDFNAEAADIDMPMLEPIALDNVSPIDDGDRKIEETDEDSDRILLEIFASEASTHLDVLESFIRTARDSFGRIELNDDLQRALHTLKGSAQMAAVTPIADVVMPVEHLVKEMRAAQLGADSEVLDLLDTTASLLQAGLAQLDSTPYAALPGTDEWIARVAMIYHDRLDNPQTDGAGAEDDGSYSPALLNRFLGDAIEQVSAVADDITLWAEQRLGDERQHTLAATLSQVADAAENLGINAVSELAQALQVLLRNGADRPLPGPDFFAVTQAAAEELIDMFDRLAANQEPQANETMVQRLQ